MVQILNTPQRRPTVGQRLAGGVGRGLNQASEMLEQHEMKKQQASADEQLAREHGINLRGFNPDERKIMLQEALSGKNQRDLESLRQQREPKKTQASQPIDAEQLDKIKQVRNSPEYQKADPLKKYQLMTDSGISKENAKAESDIAAAQEKPSMFEDEASKLAAKSSSEYRDKVVREYEGAVSSDLRIDKMMKKAESGQLSTPLMVKTLEFAGLPLSILKNPTTEEYAKLENDYVRDVTSIFPGAIKNFEIESYLKTIPGLLNSDEGKILVGKNVKLTNQAKIIKYKAAEQILKENKGVPPRNFDMAVNDRIRDQMEDLKEKFMENTHEALNLAGPKITMKDSDGNVYDIPSYDLENAMNDGLMIDNE